MTDRDARNRAICSMVSHLVRIWVATDAPPKVRATALRQAKEQTARQWGLSIEAITLILNREKYRQLRVYG